jgi:heterodisulfide reductase subunit A-like polyferredoxin
MRPRYSPNGYDRFVNVITSVEFERFANPHGPNGGKLLRPSDGKEAKNIALIQCAGSRDENHLRHCSRICCMASLKQTHYVREAYGEEGKSTIYYIDIRVIDRLEDFYLKVRQDPTVSFVKSKVANIIEDKDGNPVLKGVDTAAMPTRMIWWCWRSAWSPRPTASNCRMTCCSTRPVSSRVRIFRQGKRASSVRALRPVRWT